MEMKDLFRLEDKQILVTGGTRGIGRAIVSQLVEAGAFVVANYVRDKNSADCLEKELGTGQLKLLRADLTRENGIQTVVGELADGPLDGLIHCAATGVHRPLEALTLRHWDWTMNLNVRAFFHLVGELRDKFSVDASIVVLSSEGAQHALNNYALVGASKGALESLCRHMAIEYGATGKRFNILSPGSVLTDAWDAFPDKEKRTETARQKVPDGRLVSLEEIASVAQFLMSPAAKGINGQTIVVDKGERIVS